MQVSSGASHKCCNEVVNWRSSFFLGTPGRAPLVAKNSILKCTVHLLRWYHGTTQKPIALTPGSLLLGARSPSVALARAARSPTTLGSQPSTLDQPNDFKQNAPWFCHLRPTRAPVTYAFFSLASDQNSRVLHAKTGTPFSAHKMQTPAAKRLPQRTTKFAPEQNEPIPAATL